MKKRIAFRKLGRTTSHRTSMLRNMVSSLIEHERIVTTLPKAKELSRVADQMVGLAKAGDLYNRRRAHSFVRGDWNVTKLFDVLGPRYQLREGGYTRVLKLSQNRAGDNAPMAVIEYVDRPGEMRAARPPTIIQNALRESQNTSSKSLQEILQDMGIPVLDDNELNKLEEEEAAPASEEENDESKNNKESK